MKKQILIACFALLALGGLNPIVMAQSEEQTSLYMFNPLLFNPAYAGSRGTIHAVTDARFQWVGVKGAPVSQFLSFSAPLAKQNLGLGFHLSNDKIGARNRTSAFVDIAYSVKLNKKNHRLNFGMSAGVDWQVFDFRNLVVTDFDDPTYGYYASKVRPNFGAGLYYHTDKFYVGVSIPRMLRNRVSNNVNLGNNLQRRHFYISGGYVVKINSMAIFKPSALIKLSENAPVTVDLNANFLLYNTLWLGAAYRYHESAGVNVGIVFKKTVTLGYAFDFPFNGLRTSNTGQGGTHEIMLSVDIMGKNKPYISSRYF